MGFITRFLGLRGLLTQALREDEQGRALELVREAHDMRPRTPWVLPSLFDLIGTLKWMRTDEVDIEPFVEPATAGMAHVQNSTIAKRADGTLPDDRFHDLLYADLLADPAAAIQGAYDRFGWEFTNELSESITGYLNEKPRGSKGAHSYDLKTFGLTENEVRTQFADYLERFAIPYES